MSWWQIIITARWRRMWQKNAPPRKRRVLEGPFIVRSTGDEETGFLSVAVITTRFTDEQCLLSSLATRKDIESCLCPLSFAVEVTRNLSLPSSFVYNNISSCSGASNLFTFWEISGQTRMFETRNEEKFLVQEIKKLFTLVN